MSAKLEARLARRLLEMEKGCWAGTELMLRRLLDGNPGAMAAVVLCATKEMWPPDCLVRSRCCGSERDVLLFLWDRVIGPGLEMEEYHQDIRMLAGDMPEFILEAGLGAETVWWWLRRLGTHPQTSPLYPPSAWQRTLRTLYLKALEGHNVPAALALWREMGEGGLPNLPDRSAWEALVEMHGFDCVANSQQLPLLRHMSAARGPAGPPPRLLADILCDCAPGQGGCGDAEKFPEDGRWDIACGTLLAAFLVTATKSEARTVFEGAASSAAFWGRTDFFALFAARNPAWPVAFASPVWYHSLHSRDKPALLPYLPHLQ
jgi:hypothetical protein